MRCDIKATEAHADVLGVLPAKIWANGGTGIARTAWRPALSEIYMTLSLHLSRPSTPGPDEDNDALPDEAWEDPPEDDTLIPDGDPVLPPVTPL